MRTAKGGAAQVGKILASTMDIQGYMRQNLSMDCRQYPRKVHRLVADAFLGPIPESFTVNHINGIKHDNRVENLEVVTRGANISHAFKVIKTKNVTGENNPRATLTADQVLAIRRRLAEGEVGIALAREYGTNKYVISDIKRRRSWLHL